MDPTIALLGFAVGVLVGLTGVGSGAIMTPALILLGVRPTVAIGSDLVAAALTKVVAAAVHLRQRTVRLPLVLYLSLGSVPAALGGALLFGRLARAHGGAWDAALTRALATLLILVATGTLLELALGRRRPLRAPVLWSGACKALTVLLGAGVGLLVSLTSIGAGSLVAAVLLYGYRLPPREVVGSDLLQAVFMAGAAALGHGAAGTVDPGLVGALLLGTVPGALLGSLLCARAPQRALRGALAVAILAVGVKLW